MEKYQTIEEYVAAEMGDKIIRKANSPFVGLLILVVGIGLLVLLRVQQMGDTQTTLCLTMGIIAVGVGFVLTAMCFSGALWHYVYMPTHSKMRQRKCYFGLDDYQHSLDSIGNSNFAALGSLAPVPSSNSALSLLYSRDYAVVLLQAGRYNGNNFEPETSVYRLEGVEVTHIQALCK